MASQADDAAASHGPLIPSLNEKSEKYCITCGKSDSAVLCSRCKGVWYCNKKCQKADWPCHKLLCSKFAKVNDIEPLQGGYRAFLFRFDSLEPDIVIIPTSKDIYRSLDPVRGLLRQPGDYEYGASIERVEFGFNSRLDLKRIGKSHLQVFARSNYLIDGSKGNKSILASVKATGTEYPPHFWAGNVVVRRVRPTSVTMADFRHILDWLAIYPHHPFYGRETLVALPDAGKNWRLDSVKGVVIASEQHIRGGMERYSAVSVHADHPIRGLESKLQGEISPISNRVGLPLRLITRASTECWRDAEELRRPCWPVGALMISLDKRTDGPMYQFAFSTPRGGRAFADYGLVVRADDKDLSIEDVKAMAHFAQFMCQEKFVGVGMIHIDDKPGLEAAMQRALDFMTWDNYLLAFDALGMPRPQRPAKETFVDVRGPGTSDDLDDDQEMDEDEYTDDSEDEWEDESDD